jgi:aldehyde dehydrogenase (NAD+)
VELANATRYGLAASIWSETATVAMDLAAQVRAGVVWVNGTNLFDANAPFGGMRESGFGREGGRAGMSAYLAAPAPSGKARKSLAAPAPMPGDEGAAGIDRTRKLYIGGKQARPDGGYSYAAPGGAAPLGNRKDLRNAVEAAAKATAWTRMSGHARAQVLYFLAENLAAREADFAALVGVKEVAAAIDRTIHWAAWADKLDGRAADTQAGHLTLALNEPFGVIGVICPDEAPLLGFLSTVLPALAFGNRVVAAPSQSAPTPALELVQVLETSDLPAGVLNIVTGAQAELAPTLAAHDEVAALWVFADTATCAAAERASTGNLKPVWAEPRARDWAGTEGRAAAFRENAVQVKTVWLPYGA